MANTLSIEERTLAQVADPTNTINLVGGANPRKSVYQPLVVRITNHVDNVAAEVGSDTERMAIFVSKRHGEPWKKDFGLVHKHYKGATPPTDVTVLFPNFDYSTFE